MIEMREIPSRYRVCPTFHAWIRGPFDATPPGVPTIQRFARLSTLFSLYSVSSNNSMLNGTLQSLSAFLFGITDQHLLVQNLCYV